MAKDVNQMVKEAVEAAKGLPENLQEAAFNRVFDYLANEQNHASSSPAKSGRSKGSSHTPAKAKPESTGETRANLLGQLNRTDHPEISHNNTSLINSLYLLRAVHNEWDIDGLTATEIAKVLTEKFRFRVTRQAINQALDSVGQLVDRSKVGNSTFYRIMGPGEQHLDDFESSPTTKVRNTPKRKTSGKAKKATTVSTPSKASTKKVKKPAKKAASKKPGPKATVMELREEGFFSKPRTIASIIDHVKHTKGYTIKNTDLSPALVRLLRDKVFTRSKNSDKQYEYTNA